MSNIHFNEQQKDFLKRFFQNTSNFIKTNNMLDSNNIKEYIKMYNQVLEDEGLENDELLKYFPRQLNEYQRKMQLKKYLNNKKTTIQERVAQTIENQGSVDEICNNPIINEWYKKTKVLRVITKLDASSANRTIQPKINDNKAKTRLKTMDIGLYRKN